MLIPEWFAKELAIVDDAYYVFPNENYQYFEIKRRMDIDRKDKENGKRVRIKDPTVAVFKSLNDDALLSIRKRKYIGLQYRQNMLEYMKDIQRQNREAKAKAIEIAREQIAEGFMRIFQWNRKKYYLTPSHEFRREET